MNLQITCSHKEDTLTLSINGKPDTYSNDKAGKQQAILDGLNAIKPITVDGDVYLPSNETLQVVAAVLYPGGIETEAAYQTVCRVTEKACAHLGYGQEVQLGPPQVPFAARGGYRKKQPPVDEEIVLDELALAGTSSLRPRREMKRPILWNKVSRATHNVPLSQLTSAQRTLLTAQIDAIAAAAGWQIEDDTDLYILPLPANAAQARETLSRYLDGLKGNRWRCGRPSPRCSEAPTAVPSTTRTCRRNCRRSWKKFYATTVTRPSRRRTSTGRCRWPSRLRRLRL